MQFLSVSVSVIPIMTGVYLGPDIPSKFTQIEIGRNTPFRTLMRCGYSGEFRLRNSASRRYGGLGSRSKQNIARKSGRSGCDQTVTDKVTSWTSSVNIDVTNIAIAKAFVKLFLVSLDCRSICLLHVNDWSDEGERKIAELQKKKPIEWSIC